MNRSGKNGGGIGIYIKQGIKYKLRADINISTETTIESIFIELITAVGKNVIIGVIYRPPNNKIDSFENIMNQILGKIDKENKIGYLMGDFNIDLLKSESCDYTSRFLEQMFTSSFIPLILRPTRITQHTATLIDNIFTNDIENIEDSTNGILFCDISDHLPIVHVRDLKTRHETPPAKEFIYKRVIRDSNVKSFSNTIHNADNDMRSGNKVEKAIKCKCWHSYRGGA